MNNQEEKDYVFYLNWEDRLNHIHKVGMLAQIDKMYYFFIRNRENAIAAYNAGFIGVSGFEPEKVYKSPELFDFFKSRILDKKSNTPCEELAENKGISMVDSFSLEELSPKISKEYKKIITQLYDIQEKRKEIQEQKANNIKGKEEK